MLSINDKKVFAKAQAYRPISVFQISVQSETVSPALYMLNAGTNRSMIKLPTS